MKMVNKIVYIAMPRILENHNHKKIVKMVKEKFIKKYNQYKNHKFFNPFSNINQDEFPDIIMEECFRVIEDKKCASVLYIIPSPIEINETVTLGAISESNLALIKNKPVYVCIFDFKPRNIFKLNHIDELMEMFNIKAPCLWFKIRPDLNISKKYRAKT